MMIDEESLPSSDLTFLTKHNIIKCNVLYYFVVCTLIVPPGKVTKVLDIRSALDATFIIIIIINVPYVTKQHQKRPNWKS